MPTAAEPLPLNPRILRWARERCRLDQAQAAEGAHVPPHKLAEWETGSSAPTARQARQLAAVYDRPFLEFFLSKVPEIAPLELVPDYRLQRPGPTNLELAALEGVQAWANTQRLNALDLYEMLGEPVPEVPSTLRADVDDDPEKIADLARNMLDFPIDEQLALTSKDRRLLPAILRKKIERVGVLVFKQSCLSSARTRGICLFHQNLPVIVIGNESPGGQAFTLAHEFGHVMLRRSAISGAPNIRRVRTTARRKIEGWCNDFAAAFLMPPSAVRRHRAAPAEYTSSISDFSLNALANAFAVSRHAMLIRLVSLGLVDARFYWREKRPQFLKEEAAYEGGGRAPYYGTRYRSALGDSYTGLVLEALETGQLGYHSASEFMGIKNVRHLHDIKVHFGE